MRIKLTRQAFSPNIRAGLGDFYYGRYRTHHTHFDDSRIGQIQ